MLIKTARAEMGNLLKAAQDEHRENIQIAIRNSRCDIDDMSPYKTAAQAALIRGMQALIDLAEAAQSS